MTELRTKFRRALIGGLVLSLTGAGAALASGGGGGGMSGGGGDMPSMSAPAYDPAAEYAKGVAAMNAKDFKAAARAFGHVTEAAPAVAQGWRLLGVAKAETSDWKGARRAYEKAIRLEPDNVDAHRGLGVTLGSLKDAKAQGELDWLKAKADACGTCADAANLKAATEAVQAAMGATPTARLAPSPMLFGGAKAGDAAYVQAVSLINERRYDEALAALDRAREVFGPHPDILTYQGYAWRKKGAYDRAESYYRQALAIAPDHVGATEYYGELKVAKGDIAGARLMLTRLDKVCAYGCAEAETLRNWIAAGREPGM
jgi:tetratricopeptide (TPR) repeat protein